MGKSDNIVISRYKNIISDNKWNSIGFFGYPKSSSFTNWFESDTKDFYDLKNNNWDINAYPYKHDNNYDLIVCTRVAYFCKNPELMIENFREMLKPGGKIIIDWGLGDHWRFDNYKIGWVKEGEHEWAYNENNFLWSTIWHDSFIEHPEFILFSKYVANKGYTSNEVTEAIRKEVPVVMQVDKLSKDFDILIDMYTLWADMPQIYFTLLLTKK